MYTDECFNYTSISWLPFYLIVDRVLVVDLTWDTKHNFNEEGFLKFIGTQEDSHQIPLARPCFPTSLPDNYQDNTSAQLPRFET